MKKYFNIDGPENPIWKQRVVKKHYWLDCSNAGRVPVRTIQEISDWSQQHKCGIRKAYGTWEFRNEAEITMFLLKWGGHVV